MRLPLRAVGERAELLVRATPRGGRDRIGGLVLDATGEVWLAVRVTAPAEGGKANDAVLRLIAERFGLPRSRLELTTGASSRSKRIAIDAPHGQIEASLRRLLAEP